MAFAISAFFPLGFYQGSDSGGRPESYPSPSRLYSALVSAAYLTFGFETPNADCGLMALGHVWRDSYVPQTDATSREERYWDLVDAIKSKTSHFRIFDWHAVYRVNMTDYAHHADSSNVLHGMQALVAISDGADSLDCAAMAIGQSRHLGGGFWCRLIFT